MAMPKTYVPEKLCPYAPQGKVVCNSEKSHNRECALCGWHPDVAERRKAAARIEQAKKRARRPEDGRDGI